MSTSSEGSGSSEDEIGQHDVAELETSEAVGNAGEFSVRDHLSLYDQLSPAQLANLNIQRKCKVCFDLDMPSREAMDSWIYYWRSERDRSTFSNFSGDDLVIPLALLESTAKLGCPSCELLRNILRTRPDIKTYIHTEPWLEHDYVQIGSCKNPFLQSNIIIIRSSSELSPDICFHSEPGYKPMSGRIEALSTHPWLTSKPSPSDVVDFVKPRIEHCLKSHPNCSKGREGYGSTGYLPTRVIAVLDNQGSAINPVLVPTDLISITNNDSRRYIALSHCWGKSQPITTTAKNYEEHLKSIPWSALPQTFQDTILVVRALGVRFLWIDSLCIIQDKDTVYTGNEDTDWAREASKMAEVYTNAWLTIAATSAADGTQGLFLDRPGIEKLRTSGGELSVIIRPMPDMEHSQFDLWGHSRKDMSLPLLWRGWALQEQVLSSMILHFTRDELLFECRSKLCCECSPTMTLGATETDDPGNWPPWRRQGITKLFQGGRADHPATWQGLVHNYSVRDLTYDSDILPGLSGVATVYQRHFHRDLGRYLAGLWEEDLMSGLLWRIWEPENARRSVGNARSSPPSWSWASISGQIWWDSWVSGQEIAEILHVSCDPSTADDKGMVKRGRLTLRGKLVPFTIQYTQDDSAHTMHLTDEHREQWPGLATELDRDNTSTLNLFHPDVPLSSTSDIVPSGGVLYLLPLFSAKNNFESGMVIRKLPEGLDYTEEKDAGRTSPHSFARVGYFKIWNRESLDLWSQVENTIVTIV